MKGTKEKSKVHKKWNIKLILSSLKKPALRALRVRPSGDQSPDY
jgi:hypothetical protein